MPAVTPHWFDPPRSHKAKEFVELSIQVSCPGHKIGARGWRRETGDIRDLRQSRESSRAVGQTHHPPLSCSRSTLQPLMTILAKPRRPSLPPQSLHTCCSLYLEFFSVSPAQPTPTYLSGLSSKAVFSEGFLNFWAQVKPTLHAATAPVHPQQQNPS